MPLYYLLGTVVVYRTQYCVATPRDAHFSRYILPLRLHIAGGMGALLAGPWQFSQKLRARTEPAPLARPHLFSGGRARLDCRLRRGRSVKHNAMIVYPLENFECGMREFVIPDIEATSCNSARKSDFPAGPARL